MIYRSLPLLLVLLFSLSAKSQTEVALKNYFETYFAILNNVGDVSLSTADRKVIRNDLIQQRFAADAMVYNHVRTNTTTYISAGELLDNLIIDYPQGVTFRLLDLQILDYQLVAGKPQVKVRLRQSLQAGSRSPREQQLDYLLSVRTFGEQTMSAEIVSIERVRLSSSGGGQTDEIPTIIQELERNMVFVEGGSFLMGCTKEQQKYTDCPNEEKPAHQVTLKSFFINKYEVTQAQWEAVMGTTVQDERDNAHAIKFKLAGEAPDYPMYFLTWEDTQEFIRRLNAMTGKSYRLPTEAEWEYAARGGKNSNGFVFSGGNEIGQIGTYKKNSNDQVSAIGQKQPYEIGLYDMSGNVFEWCSDWYEPYNSGALFNPQGGVNSKTFRIRRGGSWLTGAGYCRVSNRLPVFSYLHVDTGFRLVSSK